MSLGKDGAECHLSPELYFYLKDGFKIVEIIPEHMDDPESLNYGVLIKWDNPLYGVTKKISFLSPVIRIMGKTLFLSTVCAEESLPH